MHFDAHNGRGRDDLARSDSVPEKRGRTTLTNVKFRCDRKGKAMSENRGGSPVVKAVIKGVRKSFKIFVPQQGEFILVDNDCISDINITIEGAFAANRTFVQELEDLSNILSDKAIDNLNEPENLRK